jgi:hypothetical protein
MEDMEIDEVIDAMKKEDDDVATPDFGNTPVEGGGARSTGQAQGTDAYSPLSHQPEFDTSRSRAQRNVRIPSSEHSPREIARHLLRQVEDRECDSREIIYLILNRMGEKAVGPAIQMLNVANNIHSRKALATALIR